MRIIRFNKSCLNLIFVFVPFEFAKTFDSKMFKQCDIMLNVKQKTFNEKLKYVI